MKSTLLAAMMLTMVFITQHSHGTPDKPSENGTSVVQKASDLELTISLKQPIVTKGKYVQVMAKITNKGENPVTLVKPGDGSAHGWRTPVTGLSILSANDKKASHPKKPRLALPGRCGNINPLRANEVVTLEKGKSVIISQWAAYQKMNTTGKFRVVFYYSNQPKKKWQGLPLGKHDAEAMKKVKASTPCNLISNELTFKVVSDKESK